jgi:hypothetical protein
MKSIFLDCAILALLVLASIVGGNSLHGAQAGRRRGFVAMVIASQPLAYYRLQALSGNSEVGETSFSSEGGGTSVGPGAPIGDPGNRGLRLDGHSWISTTQKGGLPHAGSMMAWVNLAELPSGVGHPLYIAGESQGGNDFDMQFETDDTLRFYNNGGGSHLTFAPNPASLVHHWHMIVVTSDTIAHTRVIYWDGIQVIHDTEAAKGNKNSLFSIGASRVFGGRNFNGTIDEVALWDRALRPAEVVNIYNSGDAAAAK